MMWRRTLASMTKPVIIKMSTDDENYSRKQEQDIMLHNNLFKNEEKKP